jgi:hypothetical protein
MGSNFWSGWSYEIHRVVDLAERNCLHCSLLGSNRPSKSHSLKTFSMHPKYDKL